MDALWDFEDEQVITLLRAAKDRIDSFFEQAAEIMLGEADTTIA